MLAVAPKVPLVPELPVKGTSVSTRQLTIDIDDSATPPPAKKTAMSCLLGDVYIVKVEKAVSLQDRVSEEINNYKLEDPIPT